MAAIPPPPITAESGSFAWVDWYNKLVAYLNNGNSIPWSVVSKIGSSLADLATRNHSDLQNVQGHANQYHISSVQYAALGSSYVNTFNTRTGAVTLTSGDVTTALTYTPYNATNPAGYITTAGAPVQSVAGKTGAVTLVPGDVSLGNVDNTSDANKPVSTAQATAIALKAALAGSSSQAFAASTLSTSGTITNTAASGIVDFTGINYGQFLASAGDFYITAQEPYKCVYLQAEGINVVTVAAAGTAFVGTVSVSGALTAASLAGVTIDSTTNKPVTKASLNGGALAASVTNISYSGILAIGSTAYLKCGATYGFLLNDSADTKTYFRIFDSDGHAVFYPGGTTETTISSSGLKTVHGFGCNGASYQTSYASGGAVTTTGAALAGYGYTTAAQANDIITKLNNVIAALVANGIMS